MTEKICKTCNACEPLYGKLLYFYWEIGCFYCTAREETINLNDVCDKWRRKKRTVDLSSERFERAKTEIKEMMKYLK